jgi:LEA14-like dessication related protein
MFLTKRRIVLMLAVVAVAGAIIALPYISSLTATGLDRVTIELSNVEFVPASDDQKASQIDIVFHLTNPTDKTVTTSKIEYNLFANNMQLGDSILSFEDIPPNGRPAILPQQSINLTSSFQITPSQSTQAIFSRIANSPSDIKWKVQGEARVESAITLQEKQFSDEL